MKKLLALVLALVMTLGLATVSASATTFTDDADIDHQEAVEVMNALNIINGMGDGKFDPNGNVTRAQMAKMVTISLLGDVEVSAFTGAASDLKDVSGHWAEGYIKYCYSQGIISGRGNGIFDPNANVTTAEASKMLLVALGYNSDVRGYTGDQWAINVARDAQQRGLYKEIANLASNKAMDRDDAAQLIYNTLNATRVEEKQSIDIKTGNITYSYEDATGGDKTLLKKTFGAVTKYAYIVGVEYDSTKKEYTYTTSKTPHTGANVTAIADDDDEPLMGTFKDTVDHSALMGQYVEIISKTENGKTTIYGVASSKNEKMLTAVGNDMTISADSKKVTVSKVDYKTEAAAVDVYTARGYLTSLAAAIEAHPEWSFDLYDVDEDGKAEIAFVAEPLTFGQVTFKGTSSITIKLYTNSAVSYDLDDITLYSGAAKDDFVAVIPAAYTADDTVVVNKIETLTSTASAVRGADSEVQIDGTWYEYEEHNTAGFITAASVGDSVEYAVINGIVFAMKKTNGTSVSDILYVIAADKYDDSDPYAASSTNVIEKSLGTDKGVDTRVVLPDGTSKVVKAMRVDILKNGTGSTDGNESTDSSVKFKAAPGLYTYKVNSNNVYELKVVKEANGYTDGYGVEVPYATGVATNAYYVKAAANKPADTTVAYEATTFYVKGTGNVSSTIDGTLIADDAVIYLYNSNGDKVTVVSGKTLKTMNSYGAGRYHYVTKKTNGVNTVIVAYLTAAASYGNSEADTAYGYITVAGAYSEDGDDGRITFKVWNGEAEVELTDVTDDLEAGDTDNYAKGTFVSYTTSSVEGEVTEVTPITDEYAIVGYDGAYNLYVAQSSNFASATNALFKENNKTKVIYVNTKDVVGVEGGSIQTAQELAENQYVVNAVASIDGDELDVLFIDVNNKLEDATYTIAAPTTKALDPAVANVSQVANNSTATSAKAGDTATLKFTTTGTSTGATVTATFTKADGTTFKVSKPVTDAGNYTVDFEMPAMNITAIAFSVVAG